MPCGAIYCTSGLSRPSLVGMHRLAVGKPRVQSMVPQAVYTRRDASLDGAWVQCRLQGKWPFHQEFAFAVFLSVRIYVYMSVCLACLSCLSVIRPHRKANGKHCKKITSSSRDRLELFDFPLRFDAIPIRAKTGSVTALVSRTGQSLSLACCFYKACCCNIQNTHKPAAQEQ